jgi:hypothetical protein
MKLKIDEIACHRNGICGNGFHAVRFHWKPEDGKKSEAFLGIVFDEEGSCAVLSLDRIAECGVAFGPNSWRGDHFEGDLRAAINNRDHPAMPKAVQP